jgi:hypothetical protein
MEGGTVSLNLLLVSTSHHEKAITKRRRACVRTATVLAATFSLILPFIAGSAAALPPDEPACEVHVTPSIGISCGDHKLDLSLTTRFRTEIWDGFAGDTDTFYGIRTRVGARYSFRDAVILFGEFQDARMYRMDSDTSGAGALYRRFGGSGDQSKTKTANMRQVYAEVRPITGLAIRGGRQDIKLGTQVVNEGAWKYLQVQRASQRLVGTVGWTNVERSNDGFAVAYDTEGYNFYGFAANPTTGVFDHDSAYHRQKDIVYGGLSVTAKRGEWIDNTEIRTFFLGYNDDRPIDDGGLPSDVEVYTLGYSVIGVYPLGPGNVDLLLWGAGQAGKYNSQDHWAYAFIGEAGYQLSDVWSKPWLRAGVNFASGGNNEGDHNTFFNLLPTNHLYYGFADQLAFQNLVDVFVQLMLKPHDRISINLMFHEFYLANDDDFQYFGSGAFNKQIFGYGSNTSGGEDDFGRELDVVANVDICKGFSFQGGYARMWGGDVVDRQVAAGVRSTDELDFGYLQFTFSY